MAAVSVPPMVLTALGRASGLARRPALPVLLLIYVLLATVGPLVAPHSPTALGEAAPFAGVSTRHFLGTDELGRDLFSRLLAAAQVGILVGAASVGIALVAGSFLGIVAGYVGGVADGIISRLVDFLFAFPEFLLGILVIAALGPGLLHAALAIGIVYTPRFARVARGQAVGVKSRSYIEAAQLARRSGLWILIRHVIPNSAGPLVVLTALSLATSQLTYAGLSFLGFGARPPTPDYGQMLADGSTYMLRDPLLVIAPAVALTLLVLGFNLIGDLARDAVDPRLRLRGHLEG